MNIFEEAYVYPVTIAIRKSKDREADSIFTMMGSYTHIKRRNRAHKVNLVKELLRTGE